MTVKKEWISRLKNDISQFCKFALISQPLPHFGRRGTGEGEKPPKKSRVNSDGHPDNTGKTMWEMGKTILLFQLLYAKGSD